VADLAGSPSHKWLGYFQEILALMFTASQKTERLAVLIACLRLAAKTAVLPAKEKLVFTCKDMRYIVCLAHGKKCAHNQLWSGRPAGTGTVGRESDRT
jgi:hypothetical protein